MSGERLPSWMERTARPMSTPRLRYVIDLPTGSHARPLLQMALIRVRELAASLPDGSARQALTMLAGGRVEEDRG